MVNIFTRSDKRYCNFIFAWVSLGHIKVPWPSGRWFFGHLDAGDGADLAIYWYKNKIPAEKIFLLGTPVLLLYLAKLRTNGSIYMDAIHADPGKDLARAADRIGMLALETGCWLQHSWKQGLEANWFMDSANIRPYGCSDRDRNVYSRDGNHHVNCASSPNYSIS